MFSGVLSSETGAIENELERAGGSDATDPRVLKDLFCPRVATASFILGNGNREKEDY